MIIRSLESKLGPTLDAKFAELDSLLKNIPDESDDDQLMEQLNNLFNQMAPQLLPLLDRIESWHMNLLKKVFFHVPTAAMQLLAINYFTEHFKNTNREIIGKPTFRLNETGNQFGVIMTIQYKMVGGDEKKYEIKYFIKVHSEGPGRTKVYAASPINPVELFCYRLFEKIGMGPKAYLIPNPFAFHCSYIATQDSGFTKKDYNEKSYSTWADITKNHLISTFLGTESVMQFLKIDALESILNLYDITDNDENFGCTLVKRKSHLTHDGFGATPSYFKWKIIDFAIAGANLLSGKKIFKSLEVAYTNITQQLEKPIDRKELLKIIQRIIDEFESGRQCFSDPKSSKMSLPVAAASALCDTLRTILQNNSALNVDIKAEFGDLGPGFTYSDDRTILAKFSKLTSKQSGNFGHYIKVMIENYNRLKAEIDQRCDTEMKVVSSKSVASADLSTEAKSSMDLSDDTAFELKYDHMKISSRH